MGHVRPSRLVPLALVTVLAVFAAGPPVQAQSSLPSGLRRAVVNVTGMAVQSPTAPTPSAGDGIGPGTYLLIYTSAAAKDDEAVFICTGNFVWTDGTTQYLGAAGHCFLPNPDGGSTLNPAMVKGSDPYVDHVEACVSGCAFGGQTGAITGNFVNLGAVVYARQWAGNADDGQVGNDFGLVEIPSSLAASVRPAVPVWGGPTAGTGSTSAGTPGCLYGNGVGLGETFVTKARSGVFGGTDAGAWYGAIPGSPGDSGSAVVNCLTTANTAAGIFTHLVVGLEPGVVAGTTVPQIISMAHTDAGLSLSVVTAS